MAAFSSDLEKRRVERWVNDVTGVRRVAIPECIDMDRDLQDGVILAAVFEQLTGEDLHFNPWQEYAGGGERKAAGMGLLRKLHNALTQQGIKTDDWSPHDVVTGNRVSSLKLIYSMADNLGTSKGFKLGVPKENRNSQEIQRSQSFAVHRPPREANRPQRLQRRSTAAVQSKPRPVTRGSSANDFFGNQRISSSLGSSPGRAAARRNIGGRPSSGGVRRASGGSTSGRSILASVLLGIPGNHKCCDCFRVPSWAAVDYGVLLCTACAELHRTLANTIRTSDVRAGMLPAHVDSLVQLDTISEDSAKLIRRVGNQAFNAFFEHKVESVRNHKPYDASTGKKREEFLSLKYCELKFVDSVSSAPQEDLWRAAGDGRAAVEITSLVLHGANVDALSGDQGTGPLHEAARGGHLSTVIDLVAHGANVNITTSGDLMTPLHHAVMNQHLSVVKWLVRAGAAVGQRSGVATVRDEKRTWSPYSLARVFEWEPGLEEMADFRQPPAPEYATFRRVDWKGHCMQTEESGEKPPLVCTVPADVLVRIAGYQGGTRTAPLVTLPEVAPEQEETYTNLSLSSPTPLESCDVPSVSSYGSGETAPCDLPLSTSSGRSSPIMSPRTSKNFFAKLPRRFSAVAAQSAQRVYRRASNSGMEKSKSPSKYRCAYGEFPCPMPAKSPYNFCEPHTCTLCGDEKHASRPACSACQPFCVYGGGCADKCALKSTFCSAHLCPRCSKEKSRGATECQSCSVKIKLELLRSTGKMACAHAGGRCFNAALDGSKLCQAHRCVGCGKDRYGGSDLCHACHPTCQYAGAVPCLETPPSKQHSLCTAHGCGQCGRSKNPNEEQCVSCAADQAFESAQAHAKKEMTSEVLISGNSVQQTWNKWKPRWMALTASMLVVYNSEGGEYKYSVSMGEVVNICLRWVVHVQKRAKKHCIVVTTTAQAYTLFVEQPEERDEWMTQLRAAFSASKEHSEGSGEVSDTDQETDVLPLDGDMAPTPADVDESDIIDQCGMLSQGRNWKMWHEQYAVLTPGALLIFGSAAGQLKHTISVDTLQYVRKVYKVILKQKAKKECIEFATPSRVFVLCFGVANSDEWFERLSEHAPEHLSSEDGSDEDDDRTALLDESGDSTPRDRVMSTSIFSDPGDDGERDLMASQVWKQGKSRYTWKERYLVLTSRELSYSSIQGEPRRHFLLVGDILFARLDTHGKRNVVEVRTRETTYRFYCQEEKQTKAWLEALHGVTRDDALSESDDEEPVVHIPSDEKIFGKVWKRGRLGKTWNERWCVLTSTELALYSNEGGHYKSGMLVENMLYVATSLLEGKKKKLFEIRSYEQNIVFYCDNDAHASEWEAYLHFACPPPDGSAGEDTESSDDEEPEGLLLRGHVMKQGKNFATWKTRWMELTDAELVYYVEKGGRQKGMMLTKDITIARRTMQAKARQMCLEIGDWHGVMYVFYCFDSALLDSWLEKVKSVSANILQDDGEAVDSPKDHHGEDVIFSGELLRRVGWKKKWRTRWFVLTNKWLAFYDCKDGDLLGCILAEDFLHVRTYVDEVEQKWCIEIGDPEKTSGAYVFFSDSEEITQKWFTLLQGVCRVPDFPSEPVACYRIWRQAFEEDNRAIYLRFKVGGKGSRATFDQLHKVGLPGLDDMDFPPSRVDIDENEEDGVICATLTVMEKNQKTYGTVYMVENLDGQGWLVQKENWKQVITIHQAKMKEQQDQKSPDDMTNDELDLKIASLRKELQGMNAGSIQEQQRFVRLRKEKAAYQTLLVQRKRPKPEMKLDGLADMLMPMRKELCTSPRVP